LKSIVRFKKDGCSTINLSLSGKLNKHHIIIMRQLFILIVLLSIYQLSFGQTDMPSEVTPQVLQKIKAEVEKKSIKFKEAISKNDLTPDQIEFTVDTFKIEQIEEKSMEIDYSTVGMNNALDELTNSYDKLMNKYYNKLLKLLKAEDKPILIGAQKAWINYRDAETRLIGVLTKEEYSGGGSIQSNIAADAYSGIVVKRTIEIFSYYDAVLKEK
jgi:uncharacterized protein YecT (DUF1311 family)